MNKNNLILVLEDDKDDQKMLLDAFEEQAVPCELLFFDNGERLLEYLQKNSLHTWPALIILDLNVPAKNGKEVLEQIKTNRFWKSVPVIIFTTSSASNDVLSAYELGAAGYIPKPLHFRDWRKAVKSISSYWFDNVMLPSQL